MTETEVEKVRVAIKEVKGIYRKRIAGTEQAFINKKEYDTIMDAADTNKLANASHNRFSDPNQSLPILEKKPKNEKTPQNLTYVNCFGSSAK
jgi:hypothetical protein